MNVISTTITTTAQFSSDGLHRYSLEKIWDEKKPKLLVMMLVAGTSDGKQTFGRHYGCGNAYDEKGLKVIPNNTDIKLYFKEIVV